MMGYDDQGPIVQEQAQNRAVDSNHLLTQVFYRMFLGLLATAIAASCVYFSGALVDLATSGGYIACLIAEFIVAIVFSLGFRKFSSGVVTALFFVYSILTGVTFSVLFVAFELESIVYAFAGTAALFGVLAYIGKNTKADLTKLGTVLTITLVIAIVVSIVNIFIGNSFIDIALDWVILFVFMGFTVYDMNKIVAMQNEDLGDSADKLYVYGAMQLYLDFINLFIRLLSLFGKRK